MELLLDMITGPYAGIIIAGAGMLAAVFTAFSRSRKLGIAIVIVNALAYAGSMFAYIWNYITGGPASGYLVNLGLSGVILSVIILLCGLNILFFMALNRLAGKNFIREIILLSFTVIAVLLLIMADSPVLLAVSVSVCILGSFNLLVSTSQSSAAAEYTGRFGMRAAVPAALVLLGFSLLSETGNLVNLSSYMNAVNTRDPLLLISAVILGAAVYLYLFMYPFQGTYLKLARRVSPVPAFTLWFLYIPSGLVLLIKFSAMFASYYGRHNIYGFAILSVLAFLNLFGAGLGAIRVTSLKRIFSMFMLFQLGTVMLVTAAGAAAGDPGYPVLLYELAIMVITLIAFMPLSVLVILSEKTGTGDSISNTRNLIRSNPYISLCFIIMFLWWLAADIYIFFLKGPLAGAVLLQEGAEAAVISFGFIAALILITADIAKFVITFFSKPLADANLKKIEIPRVFYAYLGLFLLVALSSVVLAAYGKIGLEQGGVNIWSHTFYIFK